MKRGVEVVAETGFMISALAGALIVFCIFGFMLYFGLPMLQEGGLWRLFTNPWSPRNGFYGVFPMIAATAAIASGAVVVAFPASLGCAALICVFAPGGFGAVLRKAVQMATGIPTVVYGFVGIFLLVPLVRSAFQGGSGFCVLTAVLMLALLISPTMILFFSDSFDRVPKSQRDAVDALGGTAAQKLLYVMIPGARKGIVAGVVIALGRALGDTLIALMLAGNAIQVPSVVTDSARTLTAHIALVVAADFDSMEFKSIFACGILLYIFAAACVFAIRMLGPSKGGK